MNVHLKATLFLVGGLAVLLALAFAASLWTGYQKQARWTAHVAESCPSMREAIANGTAGRQLTTFQYYISECERLGV